MTLGYAKCGPQRPFVKPAANNRRELIVLKNSAIWSSPTEVVLRYV
jgi:hypothetical protein